MSGSSFASLIEGLVSNAFVIIGDLASVVTYTAVSATVYDPSTGATTDTSQVYTFNALMSKFGADEVDSKIVIESDAKLTISGGDLPVRPQEGDSLSVLSKGITTNWTVKRELSLPGGSVRILHVREA